MKLRRFCGRWTTLLSVAALGALLASTAAFAAGGSNGGVIYGCATASGNLFVVRSASDCRRPGETLILLPSETSITALQTALSAVEAQQQTDQTSIAALQAQMPIEIEGIVNPDGTVGNGSGFTVTHKAAGDYVISFPAGTFSCCTAAFPVMVVSPFGINDHVVTPLVSNAVDHGDGSARYEVYLSSTLPNLNLADNAFMFTVTQVQK